jgi:hypothetical protein
MAKATTLEVKAEAFEAGTFHVNNEPKFKSHILQF